MKTILEWILDKCNKLFFWLKDSCKEPYGKYSSKRIIAYVFTLVACFEAYMTAHLIYNMVFENVDISGDSIESVKILVTIFGYTLIMILLLLGVVSSQQIFQQKILGGMSDQITGAITKSPSQASGVRSQAPANSRPNDEGAGRATTQQLNNSTTP